MGFSGNVQSRISRAGTNVVRNLKKVAPVRRPTKADNVATQFFKQLADINALQPQLNALRVKPHTSLANVPEGKHAISLMANEANAKPERLVRPFGLQIQRHESGEVVLVATLSHGPWGAVIGEPITPSGMLTIDSGNNPKALKAVLDQLLSQLNRNLKASPK